MEEGGTGNRLEEPRTTRPWTPLSLYNSDYVALLKEREKMMIRHDFIRENIVSVQHRKYTVSSVTLGAGRMFAFLEWAFLVCLGFAVLHVC